MYIKKRFAFTNKTRVLALAAILAAALAAWQWDGVVRAEGSQPKPISKPDGEVSIVIDPQAHRLAVFVDGIPSKAYPVAIGKQKTPTPIGDFTVVDKHINWGSGFGTRWVGLSVPWGMYGIHGTNRPGSIGTHSSHGCIRMLNRHVEELYPWVKIGTKVTIYGHALRGLTEEPRWLVKGHTGPDVQLVQNRLRAAGYFNGTCNGIFGPATDRAVREYERSQGLLVDGIVDPTVYESLGLIE